MTVALGILASTLECGSNLSILATYKVPQKSDPQGIFKVNPTFYFYESIFEMFTAVSKSWFSFYLAVVIYEQQNWDFSMLFCILSILLYQPRLIYGYSNWQMYQPMQNTWINMDFTWFKESTLGFIVYFEQLVLGP